jgi:Fe-S cluster assembly iron-binding protein IscA
MLSLTHAARHLISDMLAEQDEGMVLRISASPGGPHIGMDRVRVGDDTFNFGSRCVLAIDQMVLRRIAGHTLDVDVVDGRSSLVLVGE